MTIAATPTNSGTTASHRLHRPTRATSARAATNVSGRIAASLGPSIPPAPYGRQGPRAPATRTGRLTRAHQKLPGTTIEPGPEGRPRADGRGWDRTSDLPRVKRALSR